jgi:hypothetical protein
MLTAGMPPISRLHKIINVIRSKGDVRPVPGSRCIHRRDMIKDPACGGAAFRFSVRAKFGSSGACIHNARDEKAASDV